MDFIEKLEEIKNGKLKIAAPDMAISNIMAIEKGPGEILSVYLIPNGINTEMLMLFPSPVPELLAYIYTPNPFIISYISVAHVNRLFLFTKQIYFLLEE